MQEALDYFNGNELAADVWISKYALKDKQGNLLEKTPADMHRRLAKEFARIESKYPNPLTEDHIFNLFDRFKYIIPQGSPMSAVGNNNHLESTSNCFVIPGPEDSYAGIMKADEEQVQLFKRRGGVGFNLNALRPAGTPTDNAARTSTGVPSFMSRYSNTAREAAQEGRRAALMLNLAVWHPDAEGFATIKQDLTKVTGANITLMLNDEFLKAATNDKLFLQHWPEEEPWKIQRLVPAKPLWDKIVHCAWNTAEPGLAFIDTIKRNTPSDYYPEFATVSCNPCCFAEDKKVLVSTYKGLKDLRDITSEDLIEVAPEEYKKTTGYFSAGVQDCMRIILAYKDNDKSNLHSFFEVSVNHTWPVWRDETLHILETKDLRYGDRVQTSEKGNFFVLDQEIIVDSIIPIGPKPVGSIEVEDYHTFYANGIRTGNSEIWMGPYDSCRLIAINLFGYVINPFTSHARFDWDLFETHVRAGLRLNDDLVDLELEKIDKILTKINNSKESPELTARERLLWERIRETAKRGRRTGLGITALGDTIAALGCVYGDFNSIELTKDIYATLQLNAYKESIQLAEERGAFLAWEQDEINHPYLMKAYNEQSREFQLKWLKTGRRNIALTTTAPTGSLSLLAAIGPYHGVTSGLEPVFKVSYFKKRKVNFESDFKDKSGDNWQEYEVFHSGYQLYKDISEKAVKTGEYGLAPAIYTKAQADQVDWIARVRLQAAAQEFTDHAISSTINLPNDVSEETVAAIYLEAWKSGCKGITVYREGCRDGVLTAKKSSEENRNNAIKRPEELNAVIHPLKEGSLVIGFMNDKPFEIFVMQEQIEAFKELKDIVIHKTKLKGKNRYSLLFAGKTVHKDLVAKADPDVLALTRLVSLNLRHGTGIHFIVEQLNKAKLSNFQSLPAQIARILKEYIVEGTQTGTCPSCPGNLVYQEGCATCKSCGYSKCG